MTAKAKPQATDRDPSDIAALMLVGGHDGDTVEKTLATRMGLTPAKARAALDDAKRRITLAADYHRVQEIGVAKRQLEDVYRKCNDIADLKTALNARKELNKLLDLYARGADTFAASAEADNADGILDAIRDHIAGIAEAAGAPEDYPLEERVRVVAELARETIARHRAQS